MNFEKCENCYVLKTDHYIITLSSNTTWDLKIQKKYYYLDEAVLQQKSNFVVKRYCKFDNRIGKNLILEISKTIVKDFLIKERTEMEEKQNDISEKYQDINNALGETL